MGLLFIGKRFYTNRDALGERFGRIFQLPLQWSQSGQRVKLWLIDYHSKACVNDSFDGFEVESTPIRTPKSLLRLASHALGNDSAEHKSIVIASGDAYVGLLGYLIARRRRTKFVFDVYDKYDEFGGYVRPLGFDLFGFLLRRADLCLFASSGLQAQLAPRCKATALVPNGIDTERFRERSLELSRQELALEGDLKYVGYFGSMEPDRGIEDLLEAHQIVRRDDPRVHLLIAGKRPATLNLDRPGVRYMGNLPFDQMPVALASCDVIAIPYRRSPVMDAGASNKIAEALCAQRPIATTDTPNFTANFPEQLESLRPILAKSGDPASLAHSIKAQIDRPILAAAPRGFAWKEIAKRALGNILACI